MGSFHELYVYVVLVISFIAGPLFVNAKWVEDTIKTDSDWVFITRFCFLSEIGNMNYQLEYPVGYGVENLAFYYDVPGQWSAVYGKDLTCQEKYNVLQGRNQFPISSTSTQCKTETRKGESWNVCKGNMDFSSARERWWFVVLVRCSAPINNTYKGMYLYYKLHMTNGDDLFHKEFSADEFYILIIDIVFFLLYVKLMIIAIVCAFILRRRQLLHTTYKMYLVALSIWTIHLLFMVVSWGYYGTTGWVISPLEVTGRILQTSSNVVFILMLILLAKGYTVVRGRLTHKAVIKITVFINLYIVAMVVMFIWEGALFDPGLVLYYYESPPGYGMVTIILIGWLWFSKASVFTMKHYTSKTLFYIVFYCVYTIWFWASPFVVLVAMFAMAKWTREKTVNGVQQFIGYAAHLIFLILTLPYKANKNFPYHIRTTQIGAMLGGDEYSPTDNLQAGSSGDSFMSQGPNLDIFITCKSVKSEGDGDSYQSYIPLESSSSYSSSNSSFPFRSQQNGTGHEADSSQTLNGTNHLSHTSAPSSLLHSTPSYLPSKRNQLPPLQPALHDENMKEDLSLPIIRATGLPPLIRDVSTERQNMKSSHAATFQVQ